ncbi:nuclear transport factor 2 family protein [Prosthecomicrobium sp. N25]|uniref:nuclear transport factor 2 family protein n=1 Tax=Prosthecomicrobium sp. N25 TaxID=3129254 RepID=UPI00307784C2
MNTDRSKADLLAGLYRTWGESKGAVNPFLDHIAEDVSWHSMADGAEGMEFTGRICCLDDVKRYFAVLAEDWEMVYYEVDDVISEGDKAVAIGRCGWRNKRTGKTATVRKADVIRFRGDKIAEVTEFYDSAAALAAARPD